MAGRLEPNTCLLCELPAQVESGQFVLTMTCDRCGRFLTDPWLPETPKAWGDAYVLSGVTRNASVRGELVKLTVQNLDSMKTLAPRAWDVEGKCRILLRHLARMSGYPSQAAILNLATDYPLCYSHDVDECGFFCEQLRELKWITWVSGEGGRWVRLTPLGWVESQAADRHESSQAFVAMWFASEMDSAWNDGIEPAVKESGYKPNRADREQHNDMIDDFIQAQIRESKFLTADLTGQRQGVYFEAGLAKGLGIPVIWTCRKDQEKQIHFDTRQYNCILWQTPAELRKALDLRIRATIGRGPLEPPK